MKRVVGKMMHQKHPQSSLGCLMSLATYEDSNLFWAPLLFDGLKVANPKEINKYLF
jgi:hypothetical protein